MAFADHSRRLDEAVMSHLGDGPCNYRGVNGVLAGVSHVLDHDFEVYSEDQPSMRVTTISVRVADVARSRQGDAIETIDDSWRHFRVWEYDDFWVQAPKRIWTVQQILEDDGHIRRLWVS